MILKLLLVFRNKLDLKYWYFKILLLYQVKHNTQNKYILLINILKAELLLIFNASKLFIIIVKYWNWYI